MEKLSQGNQYQLMKGWLNERQWRLYVATEAKRIGAGRISQGRGYASQEVDARKSPKRTQG